MIRKWHHDTKSNQTISASPMMLITNMLSLSRTDVQHDVFAFLENEKTGVADQDGWDAKTCLEGSEHSYSENSEKSPASLVWPASPGKQNDRHRES